MKSAAQHGAEADKAALSGLAVLAGRGDHSCLAPAVKGTAGSGRERGLAAYRQGRWADAMELTRSKYLMTRCTACAWEGVPAGRRVRILLGPIYVFVAIGVVLADTFAEIETGAMQALLVTVLVGACVLDLLLRFRERCLRCGGRKLQSRFQ